MNEDQIDEFEDNDVNDDVDEDGFSDNEEEEEEEVVEEPAPKRKKTIIKENKIRTSEYSNQELTKEQAEAAKLLQDDLTSFLESSLKIKPNDDIVSTIPTGIDVLDAILGGGVGTKLIQFIGVPGAGKSALAGKVMATAQKKWPGKFLGVYIDTEQSMTTERLMQLGVKNPPIKPYNGDITVETVFKVIERVCAHKDRISEEDPSILDIPSLIIWDSVANTMTDKGMDVDEYKSVLGQRAALLAHYLPKYVSKLDGYNICLLAINQLRDKIQMGRTPEAPNMKFLPDKNIPGGNSLLFNSYQIFNFRQFGSPLTSEDYGFDGVRVRGQGVKNKLFTPNIKIEMVFSFEHGFSNFWTNYELLKKFKRITVGGGWVKLQSYPKEKRFRQKQVLEVYKEDEEFRECWNNEIDELIRTEYIEKYKNLEEMKSDDKEN